MKNRLSTLINVALMLAFVLTLITPSAVSAQGITGEVKITVLAGKQLVMFEQPAINAKVLGGLNTGTFTFSGNKLDGGWYKINGATGVWYFHDDASIALVTFTASDASTDTQKPPAGSSTNITSKITWGAFAKIPGAFVILLLVMMLGALIVMNVLAFWESVRDRRTQLLFMGFLTTGITALLMSGLAYVNSTQGETCLEGTICFGNSPWGYGLSALVAFVPPLGVILMYVFGGSKHKSGPRKAGKELKDDPEPFWEKYDEYVKEEGLVPLGDPIECVGEDAGKMYVTFAEKEESKHREGAPVGVLVTAFSYSTIVFGLFGQAYIGPLHFRTLTQPVLVTGTIGLGSIPFFWMAFLPPLFFLGEMLAENTKRLPVLVWWFITWFGAWISPWPPILTFALMIGLATWLEDKGKNFWKGFADIVTATISLGLSQAILGFPWFFSVMGGLWLSLETWLPSAQSVGVNLMRSILAAIS